MNEYSFLTVFDYILIWFSIIFILGLILFFLIWMVLKGVKKKRISSAIKRFAEIDPTWNEEKMTLYARDLFFEINHAWMNMDFSSVLSKVTEDVKLEWFQVLKQMEALDLVFTFSSVRIDAIRIMEAEDDLGTTGDRYTVMIEGYMRRYFMHRATHAVVKGHNKGFYAFSDLYTFERRDDAWLLKKVKYFEGLH